MFDAKLIGDTIRRLREKKGLSQEVLSGLAGMNKSHLGRIERGARKANLDTVCKIAAALNLKPHQLIAAIECAHMHNDDSHAKDEFPIS